VAAKHKPKPKGVAARSRSDRAFLKKALADPGLRSKLDASQLPAAMRRRRELNARLNAPITAGSSTTERDLAHAAQAATSVRYGPQERQIGEQIGIAQTTERDTGSFYDEYQRQLAAHAANVAAFQQGAQQALAQTAQGITGLSGAEGAAMQQQANAGAAQQGVAQAGNLMPDANAAAAVRQALIGSFQGQQALQGASANTYADTMANVVAPTQKLSARAQAAGKTRDLRKTLTDLRAEEGAFNQQFRDTRRQDEFKNVLAQQTLGANVAQDAAQAATAATNAKTAQTRVTETTRHNRTAEQIARDRNKTAAKTARQKADLAAGKVNQYGYTDAAWRAMSTAQRQKVIKDFKAKPKPKPGQRGAGPDWQTNAQQGQGASDALNLKDLANRAKQGTKFKPGPRDRPGTGTRLNRHQAAQKIQQSAKVRDPALLSAALDAAYDHHLSPETVRKLIAAGYKPSKIAQALGVPTRKGYKPPAPKTPGQTAAGQIPGLGSVPR
jgi:hypothetical protein